MSLNIRYPIAGQLARQISEQTGETITDVVINALRQRLMRGATAPDHDDISIRLLADVIVAGSRCKMDQDVFAVGLNRDHITFFSQQRRAMELVYALDVTQRIEPESRLAVVGASGITCTAAAGLLGYSVTLFERHTDILSLQRGCKTRLLHPHIYDWPIASSRDENAGLPLLSWDAAKADVVVDALSEEWKDIRDRCRPLIAFEPNRAVRNFELTDNLWRLFPVDGKPIRPRFHVLILCTGFGAERSGFSIDPTPYWRIDPLDQQSPPGRPGNPRQVLVSGCGDGGLIDALRLSIECFDHEATLYELLDVMDKLGIGQHLLQIERDAVDKLTILKRQGLSPDERRHQIGSFLSERYEDLPGLPALAEAISRRARPGVVVTLHGQGVDPYRLESAIMHRVLVAALRHDGRLRYESDPIKTIADVKDQFGLIKRAEFAGTRMRTVDFDQVIIRHGAEPAPSISMLGDSAYLSSIDPALDVSHRFLIAQYPLAERAKQLGIMTRGPRKEADSATATRLSGLAQEIDQILMRRVRAARGMSKKEQFEIYNLLIDEQLAAHGFSTLEFVKAISTDEVIKSFDTLIAEAGLMVEIDEELRKVSFRARDDIPTLALDDQQLVWSCCCYGFDENDNTSPLPSESRDARYIVIPSASTFISCSEPDMFFLITGH